LGWIAIEQLMDRGWLANFGIRDLKWRWKEIGLRN